MALTKSINNAVMLSGSQPTATGEITGKLIREPARTAQNGRKPVTLTGLSMFVSSVSDVGVQLGVVSQESQSSSVTQTFIPPRGFTSDVKQTPVYPINFTPSVDSEDLSLKIFANGSVIFGVGSYNGISISRQSASTLANSSFVGTYTYIQVPEKPIISSIDSLTKTSFRVNFTPSEDTGGGTVFGYRLQVSLSQNFTSILKSYDVADPAVTVVNVSGLSAGNTYFVRMLSKNELWLNANNSGSPWSDFVTASTPPEPPPAFSNGSEESFRYREPSKSNLFAERVFAEHPISLWSLDDKADYISLISEHDRDLRLWTGTGSTESTNLFPNPSFESSTEKLEIKKNFIENPSFNATGVTTQVQWKNVYKNPSFNDKPLTGTFSEVRRNYVLNPSYELNVPVFDVMGNPVPGSEAGTTWGNVGSFTRNRDTVQKLFGGASAKVDFSAANQAVWVDSSVSVFSSTDRDKYFTASAHAKISNGEQVRIGFQLLDNSNNVLGTFWGSAGNSVKTGDASASWQRLSYQLLMWNAFDFSSAVRKLRVVVGTLTGAQTVYIDGVMLEEGPNPTPYFDGNQTTDLDLAVAWTGTVNASASILRGQILEDTSNPNTYGGSGYRSLQWDADGINLAPSMRVSSSYSNDSFGSLTNITLQPNTTYTALATIRLVLPQNVNSGLSPYARKFRASAGGSEIAFSYISEAPNAPGVYQVRATFDTKTNASLDYFRLYNGSNQGGSDVWWDNVAIVEGVYLGPYFDGAYSPDFDLLPAWTASNESTLSANVPVGQSFSIENGKVISSSTWGTNNKSLKIIPTSLYQPARYKSTLGDLGLEVGKTYTAFITSRLSGPQTGTLFEFPDVDEKFSFAVSENVAGEEELRISFTVDGVDVTLDDEISIYNTATAGNGDVWWDEFCLVEGNYSGEYFDGSTPSLDPDIESVWLGTADLSKSVVRADKAFGVANGYRSQKWNASDNLGEFSLYIPENEEETILLNQESTVLVIGRNAGQSILVNGTDTTELSENSEEVRLTGVTSLKLLSGWWDNLCIVPGEYTGDYFDGSTSDTAYYTYEWSGVDHQSPSLQIPLDVELPDLPSSPPFPDSVVSLLVGDGFSDSITLKSPVIATRSEISSYMSTLSLSMFLFSTSLNVSSVRLGIIGETQTENGIVEDFRYSDIPFAVSNEWVFASSQLQEFPEGDSYRAFISLSLRDPETSVIILANGVSIGQWSEEFNLTSLGVEKVEIPAEVGVGDFYGVKAESYGFQDDNGYYIINNNMLLGRNVGMPMVYGSNSITSIFPHPDGGPSLVIPGKGFLNDLGQYRTYTVEFWMRVNADTSEPRRIFGPLWSSDGLYIDGPFLTFKVGEAVGSHYISEWYRPMLISIVYARNLIKLMVDGEVVVDIPIAAADLFLPIKNKDSIDQDWLGFYAYPEVPQMEVDALAIYSYQVPPVVAKRRFVYGQGVEFPEIMNSSYNGKSVVIDNTFSDYTNSYRYPDLGNWIQGVSENVSATTNVLSTPNYALPTIRFDRQTRDAWYSDLSEVSERLVDRITLKPNSSWDETEGYMLFDSLNIVKQNIKAFYGIFHVDGRKVEDEVLFKIEDDATKNYFLVTIAGDMFNGYTISYVIKYGPGAEPETVYQKYIRTINETIFAGIDISRFARKFGKNLSSFFGSPRRLKVYVAGTKDFSNTFSGEISRVGFCTNRNFSKIESLFNSFGIIEPEVFDAGDNYFGNDPNAWVEVIDGGRPDTRFFESDLYNHIASYTLFAKKYYDQFTLDIATDSYWEDYIPLTYLGKEIIDYDGDVSYGLDTLQFNIDYPRPIETDEDTYNTSDSLVKTYISFQYISSGANQTAPSFNEIVPAPTSNVVDPGSSWINKKFEVVNNTVIYPPVGVDFKKLAIVVHLEFVTKGILSKVVKIKNLQISSKSLNVNQPNKIGTRFGVGVYPYTKKGIYLDYSEKNPYAVYRGSTPYLYLTKDSGVKLVGGVNPPFSRGLSMTVNQDRSSRFNLTSIQTALMFPERQFPTVPTPVFEIDSNTGTLQFFVVSSHPQNIRGRIFVIEKASGRVFSDALFFINGRIVKNPELSLNEWNMLAVAFRNNISFNGKVGSIRINGPFIFNNLSFYEETALQQARAATLRQWFSVKYSIDIGEDSETFGEDIVLPWNIWDPFNWEQVLVLSTNSYDGVSPVELYTTYSGTNKIVVGDDTVTRFTNYGYKIYKDIGSTPYSIKPL